MNFTNFLSQIESLQTKDLGGEDAQFKLAPELRLRYNADKIKANNPKVAAVLALFYPNHNNQTSILLTKRAAYNGTHSAQISFPGGKVDVKDASKKQTALRETEEEIGISKQSIRVFKKMTDVYIPPSNFLVTPFLGFVEHQLIFKPNYEVEAILEVALTDLFDDANVSKKPITTSYLQQIDVPCFVFENQIIWGATAMMLAEIKHLFLT